MQGKGFVHSSLESLPATKSVRDTMKYAPLNDNHTSRPKGAAKEKNSGGAFLGLVYKMLIPEKKYSKGSVKSFKGWLYLDS